MGSTGSGRFSDYSGSQRSGEGTGSSGGDSGTDRCRQAFSVGLEDVALYPFFSGTSTTPQAGSTLTIALQGRLVALDSNGVAVGALPTAYNYLAGCLAEGINYLGVVRSSTSGVNPQVNVDFAPV